MAEEIDLSILNAPLKELLHKQQQEEQQNAEAWNGDSISEQLQAVENYPQNPTLSQLQTKANRQIGGSNTIQQTLDSSATSARNNETRVVAQPQFVTVQIELEFELRLRHLIPNGRDWPRFWRKRFKVQIKPQRKVIWANCTLQQNGIDTIAKLRDAICSLTTQAVQALEDPRLESVTVQHAWAKLLHIQSGEPANETTYEI